MKVFLRSAFYFLFLVYPITMGLMLSHKKITIRQLILVSNTLLSIFFWNFSFIFGNIRSSVPKHIADILL